MYKSKTCQKAWVTGDLQNDAVYTNILVNVKLCLTGSIEVDITIKVLHVKPGA